MRQRLMAWVTGLTLALLIFTASALGDGSQKNEVYITTPHTLVGSMQKEGGKKIAVVVIRGKEAQVLKKQCNCEFMPYPELNLVVILDCTLEI
jgi:hypothetical protein